MRRQASEGEMVKTRLPFFAAGAYWITTVAVFVLFDLMGFDMFASGAIPVIAVTIPSSFLIALIFTASASVPFLKPILDPLMISTAAMFVLFPVLSGGLNA